MKSIIFKLFLFCIVFSSCQKQDNSPNVQIPEDRGCIEWKKVLVTDHSGYTINNSNILTINDLFSRNAIDNSKYRYYYYSQDSTVTYFPPYDKFDDKVVRVKEFTNGLEIFNGFILFQFRNNVFNFRSGNSSVGTTLSNSPSLTTGQIRALFLGHLEQFEQKGNQYKDSCFSAEFGYFNTNAGTSNSRENLIKSWKVTLRNKIYPSEYPIAYYQDGDGKLLYYSNGIQTFH